MRQKGSNDKLFGGLLKSLSMEKFLACCLQGPVGKPSSSLALSLADGCRSNNQDLEHSRPH